MHSLDSTLLLGVLISIIVILLTRVFSKENKKLSCFYFLPAILSIIHLIISNINYLIIPIYIASATIVSMYISRKKKILFRIVSIFTMILVMIPIGITIKYKAKNYASSSYANAFKSLNKNLEENYPYTEWKKVDFNKKYGEYIDRFKDADKNNDKETYYLALKEYLLSFNDGHISAINLLQQFGIKDSFVSNLREKYIGFGYGFSMIKLDDGKVVVSIIDEKCEAYKAGIRIGTVIDKWNNEPIDKVASSISQTWSLERCADKVNMEQNNIMMLTRAKEGEEANLTFINDSNELHSLDIKAVKGNYNIGTKDVDIIYHKDNNEKKEFEYKLLDEGHGYIKLNTMQPDNQEEIINQVKNVLKELKDNKVRNLIIDVRNNGGGDDEFCAKIVGLFSKDESFYLQESRYDFKAKLLLNQEDLICKSDYVGFDGKVVVLANSNSMSAAEGFVYNMRKLDNVISAGITGTSGSFGTINNNYILMPENYIVLYPTIACLDENGNIMIDADYNGVGGIKPKLKIPLNINAINELYKKGNDYELDFVENYLNNN